METLKKLEQEAYEAACEILRIANLKKGQLFVVGCSTSEIIGGMIGKASSPETANAVFSGIYRATKEHGVYLATQCCEHLNRALILEAEAAEKFGYDEVNVVPQPKAGGSFSTAAYAAFKEPVAVELIGMHLKDVAVPVRISHKSIGEAHLTCARTRAKFIGGIRANYDENKL